MGVTSDVGRGFLILIKKQITEPIRKLQDESNDTNCRCFGPGVLNQPVNLFCVLPIRMVMQRDTRFILVQAIEALRPV